MVITKWEVKTKRRPAVTVQKAKCTICVREGIWLAVSAASSSEDFRLCPPGLSGSGWGCCWSTGTPGGIACPFVSAVSERLRTPS